MTTPTEVRISPELMGLVSGAIRDVNFYQAGISEYGITEHDNGTASIKGLRVFRSGTFKDSMGDQKTWPDEQMAQMVQNFNNLKDKGILPNVPVREGHRSFFGGGGTVKGFITSLKAVKGKLSDGSATTFLEADFELTEPDAVGKLQRGTYRARSAEVGMYEANDGSLYFPVFQGFAFVDIPAVEGLYSRGHGAAPFLLISEEDSVTTPVPPGTEPKTELKFTIAGKEVTDPAAVQAYIAELEGKHSAPASDAVAEFTVNGQKVTDYSAVQKHIATLEGFQEEAIKKARKDFAAAMVSSNRILASQKDDFEAKVLEMKPDAFETFKTTMEFTQPHPVVGQTHAPGVTNTDGSTGNHSASPIDDQIEIQEAVVDGLKHSGMKPEEIKQTNAYEKLQSLRAQKTNQQPTA